MDEGDIDEVNCITPWMPPPMAPFLLELAELSGAWLDDFLLSWLLSILVSTSEFFTNGPPLESGMGHFWKLNQDPALGLVFPPVIEIEDWVKTSEDCC